MSDAVAQRMVANKVRSVAFLGWNESYGEMRLGACGASTKKAGLTIVASERLAPPDTSITAQALKVVAARPDAAEFRQALRDALDSEKEIVNSHGVLNFSPTEHVGFDTCGVLMLRIEAGRFQMMNAQP